MPRRTMRGDKRELVRRVARTIQDFAGTLHAARCIMVVAIRKIDDPKMRHAARYALQMAEGAILLTMRKFEDLWSTQISELIPEKAERPARGTALIAECKKRSLRDTADRLIAHYGKRGEGPLSPGETEQLIRRNRWQTSEELVAWVGPVIQAMTEIRDAIMGRYGIASLD